MSSKKRKAEEKEEESKWIRMLRLWLSPRVMEYAKWSQWETRWIKFITETKWNALLLPEKDIQTFREQWLPSVLQFFLGQHLENNAGAMEFQLLADTSVLRPRFLADHAIETAIEAYGECPENVQQLLTMHIAIQLPLVMVHMNAGDDGIDLRVRYIDIRNEANQALRDLKNAMATDKKLLQ